MRSTARTRNGPSVLNVIIIKAFQRVCFRGLGFSLSIITQSPIAQNTLSTSVSWSINFWYRTSHFPRNRARLLTNVYFSLCRSGSGIVILQSNQCGRIFSFSDTRSSSFYPLWSLSGGGGEARSSGAICTLSHVAPSRRVTSSFLSSFTSLLVG